MAPTHWQVAIDGPAGAGKSTVAKLVAERLGCTFVDTGALYRCVALAALRQGLSLSEPEAIGALSRRIQIRFGALVDGRQSVWLDGEDVTDAIRTPEVHAVVSPVSAIPAVREALLAQQRELAASGPVVMEGRDVQTVVLPDAQTKVYLDASAEERARRRFAELPAGSMSYLDVLANVRDRDTRDSSRSVAPLKPAAEAVVVATDGLTIDEVVGTILAAVARTGGPETVNE